MTEPAHPVKVLGAIVLTALVIGRVGGPFGAVAGAIGTVAHEAGHALTADLLTGDVRSITAFRDGGGLTVSDASSSGWRTFVVAAAGYPATVIAGLGLLTTVLVARSTRPVAVAGAAMAAVALLWWTPFNSSVDGIADGDQRFTWFVLLVTVAAMLGAALLPDRHDTLRRVILGAFAVGLLSDAFSAGNDLVAIESRAGATTTDADALAEASGIFSAGTWALALRAALVLVALAWGMLLLRRWGNPATSGDPGSAAPSTLID